MAKRNSFGTVEQLPSGKFRATYKIEGIKTRAPHTFKNKSDARHWLATVEADIIRGTLKAVKTASRQTLTDYATTWNKRPGIKETTRKDYATDLRIHILPTLGHYPLERITPDVVRTWYNNLSTNASASTLAHCYRTLSAIMGQAVNDELITSTPCKIRNGGKFKGAERPTLSLQQIKHLTEEVPGHYCALVQVLTWLALRPGEASALTRSDLELDAPNPTVTIRRRVSTKTGSFEYDTPKTEAGKRTLPIPPHLVPILVEHLNQYANPEPGALVFATKKGNPAVDAGSKEIKKALTRLGLGHVRTYDLRHTGQTLAAENGASLKELMHRMGHASPNASLNYQHRTQQHGRDIANRLSETATNVIPIRKSKAS